nr:unnamed protein product [Spirometra erinaceieuropaei]
MVSPYPKIVTLPTVVVVPSFTTASGCVNAEHEVVLDAGLLFLAGAIQPLPAGSVHSVVNEAHLKLQNAAAVTATGLPQAELHNTELTLGESPIMSQLTPPVFKTPFDSAACYPLDFIMSLNQDSSHFSFASTQPTVGGAPLYSFKQEADGRSMIGSPANTYTGFTPAPSTGAATTAYPTNHNGPSGFPTSSVSTSLYTPSSSACASSFVAPSPYFSPSQDHPTVTTMASIQNSRSVAVAHTPTSYTPNFHISQPTPPPVLPPMQQVSTAGHNSGPLYYPDVLPSNGHQQQLSGQPVPRTAYPTQAPHQPTSLPSMPPYGIYNQQTTAAYPDASGSQYHPQPAAPQPLPYAPTSGQQPQAPPLQLNQQTTSQPTTNSTSTGRPYQPMPAMPPVTHGQLPSPPSKQLPPLRDSTDVAASRVRGQHPQPQQAGSYTRQRSSARTPGTQMTSEEWDSLHCPISLLNDWNFFPSDEPECAPRPPINSTVNCDPELMRCTLATVPASSRLQSQCRLPLGLVIHPFRDVNDLPVIQTSVIVRCRSCRTYINPFVKFLDNNRRWRCPVCMLANTIPDEFFYDPASRSYGDPSRRPEITSPTVEFIAPSEYMLRPPQAATYVFCLEVNRSAVASGYLDLVCNLIADHLSKMPGDSRRQVAFLTYDSGLHFYILSGKSMRMIILKDLSEAFLPDLDGMINRINDNLETLTNFLHQLPAEFAHTQDTGNCLGFTLQSALKLISSIGGRVTVFNTSLPNIGPGSLQHREEKDDQKQPDVKHLGPASDFYKTLALDFAGAQVSVDLFFLNSTYCDIATISGVARHSGGSVYHYPFLHYNSSASTTAATTAVEAAPEAHYPSSSFVLPPTGVRAASGNSQTQASDQSRDLLMVESLRRDLIRYLTRRIGFEAVLRIRCTRGLNIQNFYGCFFVRSVDLLSLPNVNPDAGYAMQLEITESLEEFQYVVLQAALLYTSAFGDRRIRVHTLCLPVTDSPEAVFNYSDQTAIACLITKMAVERTITAGLSNSREALSTVISDILVAYQRNRNKQATSQVHLCPSSLRLLPAYVCGALRFLAFRLHIITSLDDRSASLELLINASCSRLMSLVYPRLYDVRSFVQQKPAAGGTSPDHRTLAEKAAGISLHDEIVDSEPSDPHRLPGRLNLNSSLIKRDGIFLLDNGFFLILLVGYDIPEQELHSLIGYDSVDQIHVDPSALRLPPLPSDDQVASLPKARRRLQQLIGHLRRDRLLGTAFMMIRHDAPEFLKHQFINALVEDRTESALSYTEFIQMVLNLAR